MRREIILVEYDSSDPILEDELIDCIDKFKDRGVKMFANWEVIK